MSTNLQDGHGAAGGPVRPHLALEVGLRVLVVPQPVLRRAGLDLGQVAEGVPEGIIQI